MDNNYLYAVANIRANELSLLSRADIDALIDAPDYKTALTRSHRVPRLSIYLL